MATLLVPCHWALFPISAAEWNVSFVSNELHTYILIYFYWKNFTLTHHKFQFVTVKEWLKSVLNYRSYPKNKNWVSVFGPRRVLLLLFFLQRQKTDDKTKTYNLSISPRHWAIKLREMVRFWQVLRRNLIAPFLQLRSAALACSIRFLLRVRV